MVLEQLEIFMEEGGGGETELQTPTLHIIHKSDVRDKSDLNKKLK